jgi:altronate hydrolase
MSVIKINRSDNVSVAVKPIEAGQNIAVGSERVIALDDIPSGHKLALCDIPSEQAVIKYGYPIGRATADIKRGEHIHTHNLKTGLTGQMEYTYYPRLAPTTTKQPGNFMGFKRAGGKAGIRNEIWIIPTVGCVNSIGEAIAQKASALLRGSVQGVYCFPHPYGCSQLGEDHENTKKALCGLVKHPNAGGVLVLGLGCENNGIDGMKVILGDVDGERIKFLVCQEHEDEISAALELVNRLISAAQNDIREAIPNSELIIGLKCGGSDGLSGITANPLVGAFSDRLIAEGGSAILTEVPEMFGAETILMNRCKDESVFQKTVKLINDFKSYFEANNQPVYENPSPGNKDGGITTLEDKALGCTQKAGSATVADVISYGEQLKQKGLNLLQAPGNDLVASTALAVSGAHIILFTTGRGTPFGAPVPTVKISTNTPLYEKKRNWIDFNAGGLAEGGSMDELAGSLCEYVIKLASGKVTTKTEQNGIRDMAVFKCGVTL